jgi:hypothetical protein
MIDFAVVVATLPVVLITLVFAMMVHAAATFLSSPLRDIPGPRSSNTLGGFLFGMFPEILKHPPIIPHLQWATDHGIQT